MSLARRHFEKTSAALAALSAAGIAATPEGVALPMPENGPGASEYQQLLIALGEDRRQLQDIQSVEAKVERKRALIGRYLPWVEGAISAESAVQDEIVARMLLWSIDVADWPLACRIAAHVLTHGLAMPEKFKRSPAAVIAEEVAEAGLKKPAQIDLATLQQVATLTAGQDMHDQVRAKLEKAQALALEAQVAAFDPEADSAMAGGKAALVAAALAHATRALALDKTSGVKKLIEQLEREQKKLAAETEA
jgi:hypothetical protein